MAIPKVSVCIPSYNNGEFLAETIDSVLRQEFRDFELIIIDDCSSDNSCEIAGNYAKADSRIQFQRNQANRGLAGNWNRCLEEARGEFIKFVFGDDLLSSPDALARMVAVLEGDNHISLVATGRHLVDRDSRVMGTRSFYPRDLVADGTGIINLSLLEHNNIIGEPSVVMFPRRLASRGFDPGYQQIIDLEMWFHLLEQGKFAYLVEPLCSFREHGEQQTRKNLLHLAHIDDYALLVRDYAGKDYITLGILGKWLVLYYQLYNVWKLSRQGFCDSGVVRAKMKQHYGVGRFLLELPLYKVYNPFYKMMRRSARLPYR